MKLLAVKALSLAETCSLLIRRKRSTIIYILYIKLVIEFHKISVSFTTSWTYNFTFSFFVDLFLYDFVPVLMVNLKAWFFVFVQLLKPDPMVVATKLLARRTYKDTGKQFNVIAASWIQFMIHDWIDHLEDTKQVLNLWHCNLFLKLISISLLNVTYKTIYIYIYVIAAHNIWRRYLICLWDFDTYMQIELTAPKEVASQCPLKSFKFLKTKEIPTGFFEIKSGSSNIRTPWW